MPEENRRVYVGNLPYESGDVDLRDHLATVGITAIFEAHVVTDKETGAGRGFAFVELKTVATAEEAVRLLAGSILGGRTLTASPANPRPPRQPRTSSGRER